MKLTDANAIRGSHSAFTVDHSFTLSGSGKVFVKLCKILVKNREQGELPSGHVARSHPPNLQGASEKPNLGAKKDKDAEQIPALGPLGNTTHHEEQAMKNALPKAVVLALILILQPTIAVQAVETDVRFTMTPTDDGFLRLDSQTGAVALCARSTNGWSCKPVEDDQLAMQDKLAALKKENGELLGEIKDLRRALDSQFADGTQSGTNKPGFKLPTDQDVDKLMTFLEKMARRFKGLVEELKENKEPGTPL